MNPQEALEALEVANQAVFELTGQYLTDVQRIILLGSLTDKIYDQIADTHGYHPQHIRNEGSQLWHLLTKALEEPVSKMNFQGALERWARSRLLSQAVEVPLPPIATTHQHWDAAPDVSLFYGRTEELATLETWIVQEKCRIVVLLGMGGIGKTTLSVKLAKQIQDQFEYLSWRSLHYYSPPPPIQELLADLIKFLSNGQKTDLPETVNSRITCLIKYLNQHRCLLVLDDWEEVLVSGREYREGYEDYRQLLRRVGEEQHQSCLLITSLDKTQEMLLMEGEKLPVRSRQLGSLGKAAEDIFRQKGLLEESTWETLIEYYGGNPLTLKIVSTLIKDVFNGVCSQFLKAKTLLFSDIISILDKEFNRLTDLEKEVMKWMANQRKPVSQEDMSITVPPAILIPAIQSSANQRKPISQEDMSITVPPAILIPAIQSLVTRSLIEKTSGQTALFTLQPVVMEYVADKFPDEESIK